MIGSSPTVFDRWSRSRRLSQRVGIVSAYSLEGEWVALGGLPHPSTLVAGREACRLTLLRWAFVFGSPTSLLLRSECIRGREVFYDEQALPAAL